MMYQDGTNPYVGYEYKEVIVNSEQASLYLDCYENFGWQLDNNIPTQNVFSQTTMRLKRDRKIVNKMELTRLQRNFEACAKEIETLENSKNSAAIIMSLIICLLSDYFLHKTLLCGTIITNTKAFFLITERRQNRC